MEKLNILDNITINKEKEQFQDILTSKNIRIERIVSNGQSSPEEFWYEQDENEFVLLLEGSAVLQVKDEEDNLSEIELVKNEYLDIKANTIHRVKSTNEDIPTVWLAIFY